MKRIKTLVITIIAIAAMYHLYDRYLRPGAVQLGLSTVDVGRIVYCQYCNRTITEEHDYIRVPSNEAWKHRRKAERSVCAECGAGMSK